MLSLLLGSFLAYLIGSIPTAYIVGRLVKKIDIRDFGSGNVGATNVFRVVGKKWGIFVMVIDMMKGIAAVLIISQFFSSHFIESKQVAQLLYGVCAIMGHNWTVFLNFKGGKGVATTAGVIMSVFPLSFCCSFCVFVVVVFFTKYISLGSLIGTGIFPLFLWLFYREVEGYNIFLMFSIVLVVFIVVRHRSNIKRLLCCTETKIRFKK